MTPNWPKMFTFLYPFLIVELTKETAWENMHLKFLLYIRIIKPIIPSNPVNNGRSPNFSLRVTITHQPLYAYEILAQYMQRFT